MREFINKYFETKQVEINELRKFIYDAEELFDLQPRSSSEQVEQAIQLISVRHFNLDRCVRVVATKLDITITEVFDKNNKLIHIKIT